MADQEIRFKVVTVATVRLEMEIEVGANDSFSEARSRAQNVVETWIDQMFKEYAPQKWPNPARKGVSVEITAVNGGWERGSAGKDESK